MKHALGLLTLVVLVAGCTGESPDATAPDATAPDATAPDAGAPVPTPKVQAPHVIATPAIHDAICGHVLDGVGRCGNYVKIDGDYVVLEWPELGVMEYCSAGEKGAKVEITGAMRDGKFVAETYARIE